MRNKKISGIVLAAALTLGSSFISLAFPATGTGTMPNDIEIRNGDGTAPVQITLTEAFETAFIEVDYMKEAIADGSYWISWESPDAPAYRVHDDAVFIMPTDGYYELSIVGGKFTWDSDVKNHTETIAAKQGDIIPLVNKDIRLVGNDDTNSYLYQLGLVTDTGDGGMSGMSAWKFRVGSETAQTSTQAAAPATSWAQDSTGWWIQNADGSYLTNAWYQNTDGKWYYMGTDGYMLTNTTTPDGYKVGPDGAWIQ